MFADESAFYLMPSLVRTWAKKGQAPLLRPTTKREHLSVASALSTEGHLVTMQQKAAFNGAGIVSFLRHLLRQVEGKIILIWDGARVHHCQAVKAFLSAGAAKRFFLRGRRSVCV